MVLIVKRKTGAPLPPADPLVEDDKPKVVTPEEAKAKWAHVPPPNAPLVKCQFCGHLYIRPCSAAPQAEDCINYGWFRKQAAKKGQA